MLKSTNGNRKEAIGILGISERALRYKLKPAGGAWGPEATFYDAGIHNSYPTLIEVAPGDFRAVWDSGTKDRTRTHIHFGKFKLAK